MPPPQLLLPLLLPLAQTMGHRSQNALPPNGKGGERPQRPPAETGRGGRRPRRDQHGGLGRSHGLRVQWTPPPIVADGPSPPTPPLRLWRARQGGRQTPPQGDGPMGGSPPSSWQAECGEGKRGEEERQTAPELQRPASGVRPRQARGRDAAGGGELEPRGGTVRGGAHAPWPMRGGPVAERRGPAVVGAALAWPCAWDRGLAGRATVAVIVERDSRGATLCLSLPWLLQWPVCQNGYFSGLFAKKTYPSFGVQF